MWFNCTTDGRRRDLIFFHFVSAVLGLFAFCVEIFTWKRPSNVQYVRRRRVEVRQQSIRWYKSRERLQNGERQMFPEKFQGGASECCGSSSGGLH